MIDVGLATCARLPELDSNDHHLLQALEARGLEVKPLVWDDPSVDWSDMALCIVRSTWDYSERRDEFVAWAERVDTETTLWNPPELIRWNTDKRYLRDLEQSGVAIVPTHWVPAGSGTTLSQVMAETGWPEVVVKPCISASGNHTFRCSLADVTVHEAQFAELLSNRELMVQPYLKTIETEGELSMVFIDGKFSHAIHKVPKAGEFRIHEHFGGEHRLVKPTPDDVAFGLRTLWMAPTKVLYGRVDVVYNEEGETLLAELELTEPSLYYNYSPRQAERFADAVCRALDALAVPVGAHDDDYDDYPDDDTIEGE